MPDLNVNRRASRRTARRLASCLFVIPQIPLGLVLGLLLLEVVLRLNTSFLIKGIIPPAAMDPAVETLDYDIHYSDGDGFLWTRSEIKPLAPGADAVEAHVHFQTDEYGFPNAAPLPAHVDIVVLGRSYSMGAQASNPWPRQYMAQTGRTILNLSEQGSGIDTKLDFFNRFGLPRQPRWLIIEVLPVQDILVYSLPDPLLIERVAFPLTQAIFKQAVPDTPSSPIYPIAAQVNSHTVPLVFYPADLQGLTADGQMIGKSLNWQAFSGKLLSLASEAAANNICTAILYAPTKPEIYVPLIKNMDVLTPIINSMAAWQIDAAGDLYPSNDVHGDVKTMQSTTNTARTLVAQFASDHNLRLIDPTDALTMAASEGKTPYLAYDTHWSAVGQDIVAQQVEAALPPAKRDSAACK